MLNIGVLKDYTRKDFTAIREGLIGLINSLCEKYGAVWTDRNESDIGMFYLELAAGVGDMLNFNIDKTALETFLPTAKQRKNIKRLLTLIHYEMLPPTAAVTTVTFTLNPDYFLQFGTPTEEEGLQFDLTIPKYTQLAFERPKDSVYFATSEDCIIHRGETSVECPVMQGIVKNVNNLTVKFLRENRVIQINSTNVAVGSVRIIVGSTEWTQVDDVLLDEKYGTKFSVHENEHDYPYIEFHYSWTEYLPIDTNTPVSIQYVDTEGADGYAPAESIQTIRDSIIVGDIDYAYWLLVTNEEATSGGAPRESVETARVKAPKFIAAGHTMCTLKDYEAFADVVPGVFKSKAVDWNISWNNIQSYYVGVPYKVIVYIVSSDYNTYYCTQEFLDEIYDKLKPRLWSSINLYVEQAPIYEYNISARVYTRADSGNFNKIKLDIEDAILNFFKKENRDFGETFTVGMIEHLIDASNTMIDYCELDSQSSTIRLEPIQFPKLGTLTLDIIQES